MFDFKLILFKLWRGKGTFPENYFSCSNLKRFKQKYKPYENKGKQNIKHECAMMHKWGLTQAANMKMNEQCLICSILTYDMIYSQDMGLNTLHIYI